MRIMQSKFTKRSPLSFFFKLRGGGLPVRRSWIRLWVHCNKMWGQLWKRKFRKNLTFPQLSYIYGYDFLRSRNRLRLSEVRLSLENTLNISKRGSLKYPFIYIRWIMKPRPNTHYLLLEGILSKCRSKVGGGWQRRWRKFPT